jgi:FkbM family methyltransferase
LAVCGAAIIWGLGLRLGTEILPAIDTGRLESLAVCNRVGTTAFVECEFSPQDTMAWRPETSTILSQRAGTGSLPTSEVPATTLDDYFLSKPERLRMVTIDMEGFEIEVLRGAAKTIQRDRPLFCIDIHSRVDNIAEDTEDPLREILSAHGYQFEKMGHVLAAYADYPIRSSSPSPRPSPV